MSAIVISGHFAITGGLVIGLAAIEGAGVIPGSLVDVACSFARWCWETVFGFQNAPIAVALAGKITLGIFRTDVAGGL